MSSSFQNISVAYLVTWRSSFRHYQGVVLSIDYEDNASSDNCEVLIVYEIDDREIYTLLRRNYRITLLRPAVKEYLDIVLQNYVDSHQDVDITPSIKCNVLREAIDRIDERNDVPMTIAKSKAMDDLEREFGSVLARRGSMSPMLDGEDVRLSIDSLTVDHPTARWKVHRTIHNHNDNEDDEEEESSSSDSDGEEEEDSDDEIEESDEMESRVEVKVFITHLNTTRGFSVEEHKGYQTIVRQLAKDYKGHRLALYYLDADGDKIHIAAKNDFEYAVRSLKQSISPRQPGSEAAESGKLGSEKLSATSRNVLRLTATTIKDSSPLHSPISRSPRLPATYDQASTPSQTKNTSSLGEDSEIIWQRGELLGVGSFGRVFSGIDLRSGNKIAVKEIQLSMNQSISHRTFEQAVSIQREVRVLSSLDHVNIVKYYGTEYLDDVIRIFLELAPDGSIKDFLHEFGGLAESIMRRYTSDIVSGLVYLHSKGIIHRDIKSSNLLVFNGTIKLADFGCAAISSLENMDSSAFGQSMHATMAGTTIYMSPEIMQLGNSMSPTKDSKVDPSLDYEQTAHNPNTSSKGYGRKTDIWSLGITLVEMATGKAPFRNAAAAIYSVCVAKEYPSFPSTMSAEAREFLSCCLVENPQDRSSSQQLLDHPFLAASYATPLPSRLHSAFHDNRSPSLIYSTTTVNILPDRIAKTASSAKMRSRALSREEFTCSDEKYVEYQQPMRSEAMPLHAESDDDMMFFTAVGRHHYAEGEAYYDAKDELNRSLSKTSHPSQIVVNLDASCFTEREPSTIDTLTGVMTGRSSTIRGRNSRKETDP
jgi:serine/threonine protein kinase